MSIGDVYSFVVTGQVLDQLTVNVFHYKAFTSGDVDLDALMTTFEEDVLVPIYDHLNSHASAIQLEIKQVVGGFAYAVDAFTSAIIGQESGECLPPSACYTFRYQRSQLGRRHGYKRFPGVGETQQENGVVTSGFLTSLQADALLLAADLEPISGISLRPVILHSQLNGQPVIPPVPQDISAVVYSHIGTQNTRKFGRGR